jgi:predicted O-methyltransferase YrrM
MADYLSDDVAELARILAADRDDTIRAMDERSDREGFPTVGPALGGWLRLLARAVDAERVFEFGSGYGYSAYWMAPALPADGEIVLTEIDEDELDDARENLAAGDFAVTAHFEHGDAIETISEYDGPFDLVLIDNEKDRYREAFEAVREKVAVGGVVVADNAIASESVHVGDVRAILSGESIAADGMSEGIADYLETVGDDPGFETGLLPIGEGAAVSLRIE